MNENHILEETRLAKQELSRLEGKLKIQCAVKTLANERHPLWNEDSSFSLPEKGSFGIFDGVGGQKGGIEASKLAKEFFEKELNNLPDNLSQEELEHALVDLFKKAQVEFLEKVKGDEKLSKMATTVTVVKVWKDISGHKKLTIMNAGDSRVYISKKEGTLKQATIDDSRINQVLEFRTLEEMEKDGTLTREQVSSYWSEKISDINLLNKIKSRIRDAILNFQNKINNLTNSEELNKKEKQLYDQRNLIMKVLDSEKCIPNVYTLDIEDGDKIILTSDGIHDNSTDTEISSTISSGQGCNNIVEGLTSRALYRSREKGNIRSKSDDMTAMVIEVIQPPAQPLQTPELDDKTKTDKLSRLRELFRRSEKPKKLSVRVNLINPRKGTMESPSGKVAPAPTKILKAAKIEEEIRAAKEESRRAKEAFRQATEMADRLRNELGTQPDTTVPPLSAPPVVAPIAPIPPPFNIDAAKDYQRRAEEEAKRLEALARVRRVPNPVPTPPAPSAGPTNTPDVAPAPDTAAKKDKPSRWSRLFHRGEKPKRPSTRINLIDPREGAMGSQSGKAAPEPTLLSPTQPKTPDIIASVPLMITRDMTQQLLDMGLKKSDIKKLTPQEAWDIINEKTRPAPVAIVAPEKTPAIPKTTDNPEILAAKRGNEKIRGMYLSLWNFYKKNNDPTTSRQKEEDFKQAEKDYINSKNEVVRMLLTQGPEGKIEVQEFLLREVELKRKNDLENGLVGKGERIVAGISKGIEKWDNWGKAEGMKGYLQRLAKTGVSLVMIGVISGLSVEGLAKMGIGTASALGGGITSYLGRRMAFGTGIAAIMAKVPDNKKKWVSAVLFAGSAGLVITGGGLIAGGALVASSAVGLGLARLTKKYDKKIEASMEKVKEGKIDLNSLEEDLRKMEEEMEKALKEAEKARMWGKVREGAIAIGGSMAALEIFGAVHDYNQPKAETPAPATAHHGKDIELKPDAASATPSTPGAVTHPMQESMIVGHGHGGIQEILDLKQHIREHYNGDYSNAPKDIQELMSSNNNAVEYAEKLGLYNPDSSQESALLREGSTFKIDYATGDISFHDATTGNENILVHGDNTIEKYSGKMFDSDHSGVPKTPTPETAVPTTETPTPIPDTHTATETPTPVDTHAAAVESARENVTQAYGDSEPGRVNITDQVGETPGHVTPYNQPTQEMQDWANQQSMDTTHQPYNNPEYIPDPFDGRGGYVQGYNQPFGGMYGVGEHGHYFPELSQGDNLILNTHPGFADNPFHLPGETLMRAYHSLHENMNHIFPGNKIGIWQTLQEQRADKLLSHEDVSGQDSFSVFIHKLYEITHLKPTGFIRHENIGHWVARASQIATARGENIENLIER